MTDQPISNDLLAITADIVAAHVSNNRVSVADIASLISSVHASLADLGNVAEPGVEQDPAVSIRSSVKPDYIVCLEDGQKLKTLKRHLMTHHQMTPADYRAKWGLPVDYPTVAANYAVKRSELARKIGLGSKRAATPTPEPTPKPPKTQSSRKKLSVAIT